MVANLSASSNLFTFDKGHDEGGGTHTIENFVAGQDHINLVGYTPEQALHHAHVVGGNTVIDLEDGTRVTLVGYTHLSASDFSH